MFRSDKKFFYTFSAVLLAAVFFVLAGLPLNKAFAITQADCNPWPTATDQVLACIDFYNQNPQLTKPLGTDPVSPTVLPFDGVGGIAAAYSNKLNETLVVSPVGQEKIEGIFSDPTTVEPIGNAFRIDQATAPFRGTPKALYASDIDKFFVAWEDSRPCVNCRSTYARILAGDGTPTGKEIVINTKPGFLDGVAYDSTNQKFVVMFEPGFPEIKTVDVNGNVDAKPIVVIDNPNQYQGQGDVTVNDSLNQYWVSYLTAAGSGANEDDRVWFVRFDATTGQQIGQPIQVSQSRLGHNNFANSKIAYSTADGTAVILWQEYGRDGVSGVWGRTVNADGTLGSEFPLLTASTTQTAPGYGLSDLVYNPSSNSFFAASGDWNAAADTAEFSSTGLIYNSNTTIAPVGSGSFNITLAATGNGSVTLTSQNYSHLVGTSQTAVATPVTPTPPPAPIPAPATVNLGSIGIQVNQIYIWSLGVAALLALVMIVLGGYITLTAAGNADRATRGRTFITSSIIGLILLFGSYLLLRTINPDLVQFNSSATTITK